MPAFYDATDDEIREHLTTVLGDSWLTRSTVDAVIAKVAALRAKQPRPDDDGMPMFDRPRAITVRKE